MMIYTKDEYCKRCGMQLNPYGVCPNLAKHQEYDRTHKIETREQKQKRLVGQIFGRRPIDD